MSNDVPKVSETSERVSPGEILSKERIKQNISVSTVAEALRIGEDFVAALEQNDFNHLPEAAFIRGYLRNYAKYLQLQPEALVTCYDRYTGQTGAEAIMLKAGSDRPLKIRSRISPVGFGLTLFAVALVGGLTYFSWDAYHSNTETMVGEPLAKSPTNAPEANVMLQTQTIPEVLSQDFVPAAELEDAEDLSDAEALFEQETVPTEAPVSGIVQKNVPQAVQKTADADTQAASPNESVLLMVRFAEDCWIEVRDPTDSILLSEVKKAGTVLNLRVQAPVDVHLGNAPGVSEMTFNGEPVEINTGKRIAHLQLESANQG